ncbi:hypothetical protein [Sphingomonas hylomeconis]|uniref:DUF4166 domain-containing protein n=1 Tax=Sphingomonas hylomeconis TaxID=1395958 RepID=A0ABV7SZU0_9SPHN|nr:hypothetical protein [Sphingomonas hylomeconis]
MRRDCLPFGVVAIDRVLPGGGIVAGALHEVLGSHYLADDASATISLAGLLAGFEGPIFSCWRWRSLFAPALHVAGPHPDRIAYVERGQRHTAAADGGVPARARPERRRR